MRHRCKAFAADDAHIIFGAVYDEAMGDNLRVTIVATGLGNREIVRNQKPQLVVQQRTGTDGAGDPGGRLRRARQRAGGVPRRTAARRSRRCSASGVDMYDIPAFLRKQAD